MNANVKQKVYERWTPKLEKRFAEKGMKVNESKLKTIALMAHTRSVFEAATTANTPGKGAFSFGNNPMDSADTSRGSAEMLQKLFGVFVDVSAATAGLDLLTTLPMTKSSIMVVVAEPIYAGGKKDSTTNRLPVFQVKATGTPTTPYVAGDTVVLGDVTLKFVGKHFYNGNYIFQLVSVDPDSANLTVAEIIDAVDFVAHPVNGLAYDAATVDYVNGFTNFVAGFTGAGHDGDTPLSTARNNGKSLASPLSREVGETANVNNYSARMWNNNFSAGTYHATVDFTIEQIQDAKMDHDFDMLEFGDTILQDALSQSLNNHILSYIFAAGWQHHVNVHNVTGKSLNCYIAPSSETSVNHTFVDLSDTAKTIAGSKGVLPETGAIAENLSTLQRRIISRMFYSASIVKNRGRNGIADTSVMNGTNATSIRDVKGYTVAPAEMNIVGGDNNLGLVGDVNGLKIYEDGLMDLNDGRIVTFKKSLEGKPGLFFCPYILAEKITAIVEGLMSQKSLLKSRYQIAVAGTQPESQYMTFVVESNVDGGYDLI